MKNIIHELELIDNRNIGIDIDNGIIIDKELDFASLASELIALEKMLGVDECQ